MSRKRPIRLFKKEIYIIRTPRLINLSPGPDLWGHIYGIFSMMGLCITIYFTYNAYQHIQNPEHATIIHTLGICLVTVILTFILSSAYFFRRIRRNKEDIASNKQIKKELRSLYLINKYQSECFHNITHYYRNAIASLDLSEEEIKLLDKERKQEIVRRMDYFFIMLTASIQNYFSIVTDDNCSVTIKLLDDSNKCVRNFFRDPINFNKRRRLYAEDDEILIKDNTALKMITDPDFKNVFFYDDDLATLKKLGQYENSNKDWESLYNANIIVPISMVIEKETRKIVGFLAVDNFEGKLATVENKEFLFGVSDLLYNLFVKYRTFIKLAHDETKENERAKIIWMGSHC